MTLVIREIESEQELKAIGSLRYEVTVEEMNLDMRHADHRKRTVVEPLDHSGHVFAAWYRDELVATMRQNLLREADVGAYFKAYGISNLDVSTYDRVSITTRLAVKRRYRGSRVSLLLPAHGYRFLLQHGIAYDVIDSRPQLLPLFSKLGYRMHVHSWGHPEFGDVVVQYLDIEDEEHLANAGSPFLRLLRTHRNLPDEAHTQLEFARK